MCGIAGSVRWSNVDPARRESELHRMTRALKHRGPDGEGFLIRGPVALGHRRLAIIDLATGQQPLANEDGEVAVTFNGEIYNFQELRTELQHAGHVFRTRSDTEVIVHAYEQWGADCVKRFRGMFAFAIADFRSRKVFLARDQLGIKPLFYRVGKGYFAFGSELLALREVDDAPPAGDLRAINDYLRFAYIPEPRTIYRDVKLLPPAHSLELTFDGQVSQPRRYWTLRFAPAASRSEAAWLDEFGQVVRDSVQAHLVSDVPFGVFLSGGIDSTLIACQMSQLLQSRVQAFCIGFNEEKYSEVQYARQAADRCGIDLHVEIVQPEVEKLVTELAAHYGQPFADSSALPTWHVSRLARQHVPMVLSGDGGDEFFGGYGRYDVWMQPSGRTLRREIAELALSPLHMHHTLRRLAQRLLMPATKRRQDWQRQMSRFWGNRQRDIFRQELRSLAASPCDRFDEACQDAEHADRLGYAQYVDIQTYLPGDILTKVDIASMCHGLEVRPPLVDVRVAEFAATLPMDQRFSPAAGDAPSVLKPLPKRWLSKQGFPADFVHRKKMGFGIPEIEWLTRGAPLRKTYEQVVLDRSARLHQILDSNEIASLTEAFDRTQRASSCLWSLLVLGLWLEHNAAITFGGGSTS